MSATGSQSLIGAVALVTGARGGIGRAICNALAESGARVIATGTRAAPSDLSADSWMHLDVSSAEDWMRAVSQVLSDYGRLDCLINNAGAYLVQTIERTSIEQWRKLFSVNVEGALLGMKAFLPLLRESGKVRLGGSSIVNVSSTAGLRGVAFNAAYSASKGAVTMLTRSAAREFAALEYPIRVNSINPGAVRTRMMNEILQRYVDIGIASSIEGQAAAFEAVTPLRRMGRAQEIAGAAVFLCSASASYITGSELVIDGGAIT